MVCSPRGHKRLRAGARDNEGVALIVALLFVVVLTAIVVEFAYEMQVDATLIGTHSSQAQAYMAAKSSVALSMSVLAADLFIGEEEAANQGIEGGGVYDSLDEPWASSTPLLSLNDSMLSTQIDDEYGKLNLNALVYTDEAGAEVDFEPLVNALITIFELRQVEFAPIDVILDWIDADDIPRAAGAENPYYQGIETPFECKNGPMDSIEELLLLPGVTPEVFFGDPELGQPPLNELLTVHGHPEGKVNVNTAMPDVLTALFSADEQTTDPIEKTDRVLQRLDEEGPYLTIAELEQDGVLNPPPPPPIQDANNNEPPPPPPPPPPRLFEVSSEVFRIHGDGQHGESQIRIEAYVWRATDDDQRTKVFRIIDWRVIQ